MIIINKRLIGVFASVVAVYVLPNPSLAQMKEVKLKPGITITNTLGVYRPGEPVVLNRPSLKRLLGGNWLPTKVPVPAIKGVPIPHQLDDVDGNTTWDELAFQVDLPANGSVAVDIQWVEQGQAPKFATATHARLGVSANRDNKFETVLKETRPDDWKPQASPQRYQMEGPGWENDVVAFRSYFDARNGKDIFGKRRPELIIDQIGIPNTPLGNYHKLEAWGMDILKVATSLGAGALAIVHKDSLFPIGQSQKLEYEFVTEGPVRAILRLRNTGWELPGANVNSTEYITIWKGKYWYENSVTLSGFNDSKELVTGVTYVHHPNPKAMHSVDDLPSNPWVATFAKQSENDDLLGMACIFPKRGFVGFGDTEIREKRVTTTFYGKVKVGAGQPMTYRFLSGWELSDKRFKTETGWKAYVQQEADFMSNPPRITGR